MTRRPRAVSRRACCVRVFRFLLQSGGMWLHALSSSDDQVCGSSWFRYHHMLKPYGALASSTFSTSLIPRSDDVQLRSLNPKASRQRKVSHSLNAQQQVTENKPPLRSPYVMTVSSGGKSMYLRKYVSRQLMWAVVSAPNRRALHVRYKHREASTLAVRNKVHRPA